MKQAYAVDVDQVLKHFGTDREVGLAKEAIQTNLKKYGLNGKLEIFKNARPTFFLP